MISATPSPHTLLRGLLPPSLLLLAFAPLLPAAEPEKPATDEYFELMQTFVNTFDQIERNYVKDVDRKKLMEAAVRGMLSELDPYSTYISPEEIDQFTSAIEQEFGGIGIQVDFDKEQRSILVMAPLPGGPAHSAGIRAGDRIVEVDGKSIADFPLGKEMETAIRLMKGKPDTELTIGVKHPGTDQAEKITLKRALIQLPTVIGDSRNEDGTWNFMLPGDKKIAYVRLTHFTRRTTDELKDALRKCKADGMRGLILDLRFNPGGMLQQAVEVSDLFIESGTIVSTQGRAVGGKSFNARKAGTLTGFPMAVLINHFSASASEIVSACLQDHKRAVVIGQRSWGKGSVQNVIELKSGDSALKLTTASYHRPSGKNIHRFPDSKETDEWGVSPDENFKVDMTPEQMRAYQETRSKKDLPGSAKSTPVEIVDPQFKKALEYIEQEADKNPPQPAPATGLNLPQPGILPARIPAA